MTTQEVLNLFDTQLSSDNGYIEYKHTLPSGFLLIAERNTEKNPLDYNGWLFSLTSTEKDNDYCHYLPISAKQAKNLILGMSNSQLECRGYPQALKDYFQSLDKKCDVMVNPNTTEENLVFNKPPFQPNAPMNSVWFWQGVAFEQFDKSRTCLPEMSHNDFMALFANTTKNSLSTKPKPFTQPLNTEQFVDLFPNKEFIEHHGLKTNRYSVGLTEKLTLTAEFLDDNTHENADNWYFQLFCNSEFSSFSDDISEQEARNLYKTFVLQRTETDDFEFFKRHHYRFDTATEQEHLDCFAEKHKDSLIQFIQSDFRNEGGSFVVLAIPMV